MISPAGDDPEPVRLSLFVGPAPLAVSSRLALELEQGVGGVADVVLEAQGFLDAGNLGAQEVDALAEIGDGEMRQILADDMRGGRLRPIVIDDHRGSSSWATGGK